VTGSLTVRKATRSQDAVRLLLLIDAAAQQLTEEDAAPAATVGVVHTQVRLQKLDFWVRNPDYLAYELMNEYEQAPDETGLLDLAAEILESEEPDVRRFPMLRHKFGAFEELDDALAPLVERGLIRKTQRLGRKRIVEHIYFLLERGRDVAGSLVVEAPALKWYLDRTRLVVALVDGLGGTQIKDRQYLQQDYADTPWRQYIAPITEQARARLVELKQTLKTSALQTDPEDS
jgi:DNA-binding HxlR family transcriptional regulator